MSADMFHLSFVSRVGKLRRNSFAEEDRKPLEIGLGGLRFSPQHADGSFEAAPSDVERLETRVFVDDAADI